MGSVIVVEVIVQSFQPCERHARRGLALLDLKVG